MRRAGPRDPPHPSFDGTATTPSGAEALIAHGRQAPLAGQMYTCPMHPEVQNEGPGDCPICGMALEPRTVQAEEEENPEVADITRRFWVSAVRAVASRLGIDEVAAEVLPDQKVEVVRRLLLSSIIAAAAMSFSSVSVVGNALRLRGVEL